MTKHLFLEKYQTNFFKSKKESLLFNVAIILGDFTENYQFLIPGEIQSYRWSKQYFTVHTLVVYLLDDDEKLRDKSFCFILDDNTHDTNFVCKIETTLFNFLKTNYAHFNKLFGFCDGCAEQ